MQTLIKTAARRAHRALMVAVFSLVSALPGFAAPGVIANGSFESGTTGWSLTGNVRVQPATASYQATDGSKLAPFNAGNSESNGRLAQPLATIPGQVYVLSFDMGVLAFNHSQQRLEVGGLGGAAQTFSISGTSDGKCRWFTRSLTFTAAAPVTQLTFRDRSTTTSSIDLLLDHVSVTPAPSAALAVESPLLAGVPVTVSPPDGNGDSSATTNFVRSYLNETVVELSVPASLVIVLAPYKVTTVRFQYWKVDGVNGDTQRTTRVTMDANHTLVPVYLMGPPIITGQPASVNVALGGSATFHVAVDAPGTHYSWRFNGHPIDGAFYDSYTIPSVGAADAGSYDVALTDFGGTTVSEPATLSIIRPPFGNGGFENQGSGWTTAGNVRFIAVPLYQPTEGGTVANFNAGNSSPSGTLSQWFATIPGQSYLLTFDLGVFSYVNQDQQLEVSIEGGDDPVSQLFTIYGQAGGGVRWQSRSLIFTAARNSVVLTFRDASTTTSSIDLLLDNVAVTPTQDGLVLIPAGAFQMGDALLDGEANERPVHTVQVSAFRIGRYEVSKLLWDEVRTWGIANGYPDLPEGAGKAFNHSVQYVNWHAVVKWCNARSEKDGFAPAYRIGGIIYRTGEDDTVECDFQVNGYRLPKEAEWEKAARDGLAGRRFPAGDAIEHSQANYYSNVFNPDELRRYFYDISPTRGYHPVWAVGGYPYTSPVGSFAPNGYGLYDMAGNVFEMCWDVYGDYSPAPQVDPYGPGGTQYRVIRGGAWNYGATECRVAYRNGWGPHFPGYERGFRLARSAVP